ncbi:MAG: 2-C-methyl-D-erythritol 4-phosphate cytidylyltransferase [Bacilli bacterium]|nr:2-C-methyl-D-erythritol 4-phosphate cytidylyltransferase [Bacilli bacterium]MBO6284788.1 2-C-methyl-D-erythritol 4-phosphate cytidylyltransferase [Bacilli bacterium]
MHHRHICVALFGGKGERFHAPFPKQFIDLDGEPMILVTLKALSLCGAIDDIYVVSEVNSIEQVYNLLQDAGIPKIKDILPGGKTRQSSSLSALEHLKKTGVKDDAIVMIVDGDRPCIDESIIARSYDAAEKNGAAVVAAPVTDSILLSKDGKRVSEYIDRSTVYAVQTPQTFRFSIIYEAAKRFQSQLVTDDASLVKLLGKPVALVVGKKDNIKITVPEDIEAYISWKKRTKA